jgi:hypothetical protein
VSRKKCRFILRSGLNKKQDKLKKKMSVLRNFPFNINAKYLYIEYKMSDWEIAKCVWLRKRTIKFLLILIVYLILFFVFRMYVWSHHLLIYKSAKLIYCSYTSASQILFHINMSFYIRIETYWATNINNSIHFSERSLLNEYRIKVKARSVSRID